MGEDRLSCDELVALVRERGPKAVARLKWLDEIVDVTAAAAFTGLAVESVRTLSKPATRKQRTEAGRWSWPAPDLVVGGRQAWSLRTIVLARAQMPGQGRGAPPHRIRYDPAFRQAAVDQVRETGQSVAKAAVDLGVNEHTLSAWVAADRRGGGGVVDADTG
jgi:hypothetical protein